MLGSTSPQALPENTPTLSSPALPTAGCMWWSSPGGASSAQDDQSAGHGASSAWRSVQLAWTHLHLQGLPAPSLGHGPTHCSPLVLLSQGNCWPVVISCGCLDRLPWT